MQIPTNTWCKGSARACVVDETNKDYAKCPECGYRFRVVQGTTPQHRPRYAKTERD